MKNKHALSLIACAALVATAYFAIQAFQVDTAGLEREPPKAVSPPVSGHTPAVQTLVSARPTVVPSDGYVGFDSCRECHTEYYQSWHASYHRTMTQTITPDTAPAAINDTTVELDGQTYRFRRREDDFFVEFNDPIVGGERRERRLVMMTGSHQMHVFWYESGIDKTPAKLPINYLIDRQQWIPRRSAFLKSPETADDNELGRWNETCCQCHSTHPRQRLSPNQQSWDTQVSDFGIACEACHGPGEGHVLLHRNDATKNDSATKTEFVDQIVNPMKLPANSRSDVCGQCHGIIMYDYRIVDRAKFFAHGGTFRPGDVLDQAHFHQVVRGSKEHWNSEIFRQFSQDPQRLHNHFWPDGEVRVSGRDYNGMIESACFKQGELSCMSCHTMHQQDVTLQQAWRDDQLKPDMHSDAACLQCHPKYQALGTAHTHHAIDSAGSRCMNCHMPHTVYGLLKTIRSHTISSPSVSSTIETGRPNACSLCHLDQTLEQTSSHLAQWYGQSEPSLTEDEKNTAASLLHLLKGDAAQRVLQVAALGWQPAREASGTDWMRAYLLVGMDDPYDAIRLISRHAYLSLPDAPALNYDFLAPAQDRHALVGGELQKMRAEAALKPNRALLIDENGVIDQSRFDALIKNRNHRTVYLKE